MKYKVIARDWDENLKSSFGDNGSVHDLSESDVIVNIIYHGRAEISVVPNEQNYSCILSFENTYD